MNKLNVGSGKNYLEGYINIDINPAWNPDLVVDIAKGTSTLKKDFFEEIVAQDVLEHIPDLETAMTNLLSLLRVGGIIDIVVPYDLSLGAWQDPTHVRAFNENSFLYYTDWFWYMGWRDYRFEMVNLLCYPTKPIPEGKTLSDIIHIPRAISHMQVFMRKVVISDDEKKVYYMHHSRVKE